jgi:hypothetical protein
MIEYMNSDSFFWYKENSLDVQAKSDLIRICLQDKKALFYNRSEGAGISGKENYPNALSVQLGIRYQIAMAIARYNQYVVNGDGDTIDRRIAVSQNSISFKRESGELDIDIQYFLYYNYEEQKQGLII